MKDLNNSAILTYTVYDTNTKKTIAYDVPWNVGEPIPKPPIKEHEKGPTLHSITADGKELRFIRDMFSNIPMTNYKQVVWVEGAALFIFRNLLLMFGEAR